ncbi:MAG: molybdopterin molybdotransferase MoeA, partial [Eggerthellaceae bacterium]|nr:molybdopterin molybdotransferase MoeA [Eggerthellaceae bacterium]
PLPAATDAVVKYEIVDIVSGDGREGSRVAFTMPAGVGDNIRQAGEEAKAGEVIVHAGEVVHSAGVGFLTGCGVTRCKTYRRPRVAIIATGSELVDPSEVPTAGKIRNSNSYALAASAIDAGAVPTVLPIAADDLEGLKAEVLAATTDFDFVITSGGAANGDYDFIKRVVEETGELLMTTVNMRPGKAQTFGIVEGTPVFGLPGNPAAAYLGFEMIIRPALRKMQGYSHFERPHVRAKITSDSKKKDPRRIFNRGTLTKNAAGEYEVTLSKNQSSGLFGPIQRSNCFIIFPEGPKEFHAGDLMDCVLLDIPEEVLL